MKKTVAERRGWLLAGAGGAAAIAVVLALFRAPKVRAPEAVLPKSATSVGLARIDESGNALLKEEATLRDPTPLFLPSRWSASENALPADARRELGSAFAGYAPILKYAEAELKLDFPPAVDVPQRPADAFAADRPGRPLAGFGEMDRAVAPLPARNAFVEVVAEGDGQVAIAQALSEAKPPGEATWQPLEFLVAIDPSGVVRPPVLTESSRVAAVDQYFQDFLTQTLHIGERLAPGFYRVSIGP